jgi:hypothetical protein
MNLSGASMAVAAILSICSTAAAAMPRVDPSVWSVESCGSHRVIVERICNPEHCRTNAFLQSGVGSPAERTYPIHEVNEHVSAFVRSVNVERRDAECVFVLAVDEPHTGDSLFTLRIEPRKDQGYAASSTQAPN